MVSFDCGVEDNYFFRERIGVSFRSGRYTNTIPFDDIFIDVFHIMLGLKFYNLDLDELACLKTDPLFQFLLFFIF